MAEEGDAGVPTGTPLAPSLADENGVLREGWLEVLEEDLRNESYLQEVKDIQGMARSVVNARRMVGKDKIAIPKTDEEWNEFYKIGGRPDTATDYGFVRPDDFPEEYWNQDYANAAQDIMFKFGASKQLADALRTLNIESTLVGIKAKKDTEEANYKELEEALYREWGNAFEQKKHLGNVAIEKGTNGNEDFRARLVEKFGNEPDFIRFASNLGGKFAEHGDVAIPGVPTPGDIRRKIDEEMAKPSYRADYARHGITKQEHDRQVKLVSRLFQEKAASAKTK